MVEVEMIKRDNKGTPIEHELPQFTQTIFRSSDDYLHNDHVSVEELSELVNFLLAENARMAKHLSRLDVNVFGPPKVGRPRKLKDKI
jgi:hypothetical protein